MRTNVLCIYVLRVIRGDVFWLFYEIYDNGIIGYEV